MKARFWESRTFQNWIASYFIVLLIPIAFSLVLHRQSVEKLTQQAFVNNDMYIQQSGGIIDEQLQSIYSISDTICASNDILRLKYLELPFNAEKYYTVHKYAKSLNAFFAYRNLIEGVYVYCPKLECIIDADRIYTDINRYSYIINNLLDMEEADFDAVMHQRNDKRLLLTRSKLLFVQTISYSYASGQADLVLIMPLNQQLFTTLMSEMALAQQGRACILLPDADVLYNRSINYFSAYSDYSLLKDDISAVYSSALSKLQYVLSVPSSVVLQDVSNNTFLFILCSFSSVLFGGILSYFLTKRNYSPVQRLKQTFNIEDQNKDEFNTIIRQSEKLQQSSHLAATELSRLSKKENTWIITTLLNGDLAALDAEQISRIRSSLDGQSFVVAYFSPEESSSSAYTESLIEYLTMNFCPSEDKDWRHMVQYYQGGVAVILCHNGALDAYGIQLSAKQMTKAALAAQPQLGALSVYIGEAHINIEGIAASMAEALKAKEYDEFVAESQRQILLYDQTMFSTNISFDDFDVVSEENRLMSMMIEGDYTGCERLLEEILAYYTAHEGISLHAMRLRMFSIMNLMLHSLREIRPIVGDSVISDDNMASMLTKARTMQELEDSIRQIFNLLRSQQAQAQAEDKLEDRLERVVHFIHNQYADPNLSVQLLADKFSMTLPYLSREFKKAKGVGLLSYINAYRIEKAKSILCSNEQLPLEELALMVGYTSSQTLIRIFKRYIGVTPGQYRAAHGRISTEA